MKHAWLDRASIPMGVIRQARFVYANEALAELVETTAAELQGMRFLDWVAPYDRLRVGERHTRRLRGETVPTSYELHIVTTTGATRCVEVWAAVLDDGEVVFQLTDRTGRALHKERLSGLAQLGVAVQGEATEQAIFDVLGRGFVELGGTLARLVHRNGVIEVVSFHAALDIEAGLRRLLGSGATIAGVAGEGIHDAWAGGSTFIDDVPSAAMRFFGGDQRPEAKAIAERARAYRFTRAALLRVDVEGKPRELLMAIAEWLLPEDLPACRLFAAQVSAALDAARTLRAERRRNAALTAQTRIAALAGASSDLEQLFTFGAVELAEVGGCDVIAIHLVDEGRDEARLAHLRGGSDGLRAKLDRIPLADTDIGRVALRAMPEILRDGAISPGCSRAIHDADPRPGAVLEIPLAARGRVLGVVSARFASPEIAPSDIELFEAAGAHFAAAIEAQRLLGDLRQSYADLTHAQQKLVQRERLAAIGELAAVVAHEVRNPLGVLFNSFGAFRKLLGEVEGSQRTLLEIMEEEALRLNHIVGDLLDFARPITPALQRERLDVVLEEAVEAALVKAGDRIEVCREIEPVPLVPMDARLVRQALLNVAMNAVNAMPEGGTITLRLARDEARGAPMAMVSIEDTGPGIAPEVASRIFEPFFTTRATGTGLGLAVVKRIVDGHHGSVTFTSSGGRGTTFTLWLPLKQPEGSAQGIVLG